MFEILVTGDIQPLIQAFDGFVADLMDLTPLAETIREIMIQDNAESRLAGLDADGVPFAPLRGGRPLKPWEIAERGGDGPPLAPREAGSRIVAGFDVQLYPLDEGGILILGQWPSMPFLHFHAQGYGHTPARDPVGVSPRGWERVVDAAEAFAMDRIGGAA
jgi:hypothetical protein